MSPEPGTEDFRQFAATLRQTNAHLGLDPEFTAIEGFMTAEGTDKFVWLRENIDRFFFGRGMKVLERLEAKALEQGKQNIAEELSHLGTNISEMIKGQFIYYDAPTHFLPQSGMLREMLRLFNENKADDILASIDKNLDLLEGHFFMILSEAMRNARARGEAPTQAG